MAACLQSGYHAALSSMLSSGARGAISSLRFGLALPSIRFWHWLALALCLVAGAALNVYRTAWRPAGEVHIFRGFYPQEDTIDGQTVRWSRAYSKAEVLGHAWRPQRWRVQLIAPTAAPASGATVWILVNDVRVKRVAIGHTWQTIEFGADPPPAADVALQFHATLYGDEGVGVGVGGISVEPVFTVWSVAHQGLLGALAGLALWYVLLVTPVGLASHAPNTREPTRADDGIGPRRWGITLAISVLLIVWIYLGIWALLKAPQQGTDEPQHLLRAASVLLQPWATRTPNWLTLDPRFLNPFVLFTPGEIGNLFYNRNDHLSYEQVARVKGITWDATPPSPALSPHTPLATYPTGYYLPVFLLAEATTKALELSPYQNTYAYRAWTVVLAGFLWLAVFRTLLVTPCVQRRATLLFAFLLLNPMLAFASSGCTPDAVNVPLATLGVLLTYRTLVTGRHGWRATLALIGCGLTKPSILLIFASLPLPTLLLWRSKAIPRRHLIVAGIAVARAATILFCVFYAWSPPRFLAGTPAKVTLDVYAKQYWSRLPDIWISYWGRLGWLDYELAPPWYTALFVLALLSACVALYRTKDDSRSFSAFAALFGVCYFTCMTIGEYWYLPMAGYNFQGRHLLPACVGLAGLVIHDSRFTRWSLVGMLGLLNVMLMHESIVRYFGGDWGVFRASLPWPG
jgi:hypothetical protein